MKKKRESLVPSHRELIVPTYKALLDLGGSGTNDEICEKVIENLQLPDEVVDESHLGSINQSELEYQLAWARTYLKNFGVIENSARSVWSITGAYAKEQPLTSEEVVSFVRKKCSESSKPATEGTEEEQLDIELPEEILPWRQQLSDILLEMDPYGFERLSQRLLRECGFSNVKVTKKSNDGGIDGTGQLKINGIFSFNVAFQCKRYRGQVGAPEIRDFRGSLTTDIEKGVFITTGTFSKAAREEALSPGKQQIDLIDGEEFINKLKEFGIGVKEVTAYEIDESFFETV